MAQYLSEPERSNDSEEVLEEVDSVELGQEVTFEELKQIALNPNAYYCGATNKPKRRTYEHSSDGKDGVMYYAQVPRVKDAENELLSIKIWGDNRQMTSHYMHNNSGKVYVIVD